MTTTPMTASELAYLIERECFDVGYNLPTFDIEKCGDLITARDTALLAEKDKEIAKLRELLEESAAELCAVAFVYCSSSADKMDRKIKAALAQHKEIV